MAETITIVNKSGKIVSTSKHLVNVFNEAKSAYNERKAELKAFRKGQGDNKQDDLGRTRSRMEALTLDERSSEPRRSSRRSSSDSGHTSSRSHGSESRRDRPSARRGVSDSFYTNDSDGRRHRQNQPPPSPLRHEVETEPRLGELVRRHTDDMMVERSRHQHPPKPRSASFDDIDMDLAYGDLPPPLPVRRYDDEIELRAKMTGLQRLLDECNCLQHSVTAIISNLQKNPDALAAVALTLAEISNLVSKMAPGALMTLKGSFPAAVALLASPEFAIAAGAAVGVTIIALGGYKIIKKIQGKKDADSHLLEAGAVKKSGISESDMESLREIDRVEVWRRGLADVEATSLGSTVDGELITPRAAKTMIADGRLTEADLKSQNESDTHSKRRRKHRSSKSGTESRSSKGRPEIRVKSKKESSGLRMLFKGKQNAPSASASASRVDGSNV